MIYPVSGLVIKRGGKPKARNMPGFASVFQEGEKREEAEDAEDVEEAEDEEEEAAEEENEPELGWALRALENASTPRGGTKKYPPYPLVPPAKFSALTLVPPNPRVLKTGSKNRY